MHDLVLQRRPLYNCYCMEGSDHLRSEKSRFTRYGEAAFRRSIEREEPRYGRWVNISIAEVNKLGSFQWLLPNSILIMYNSRRVRRGPRRGHNLLPPIVESDA